MYKILKSKTKISEAIYVVQVDYKIYPLTPRK